MTEEEKAELREWIDWEGGFSGLLDHGVDLENDIPQDIRQAWEKMTERYVAFREIADEIGALIEY